MCRVPVGPLDKIGRASTVLELKFELGERVETLSKLKS